MKKIFRNYIELYTIYYLALGAIYPLISQYLASIGLSGTQIGTVTAAATMAGIMGAPVWGSIYHMANNKLGVVLSMCCLAMATGVILMFTQQYLLILALYALFAFFQSPMGSLIDSTAIETKISFGKIRKFGSIGYACGVFIVGLAATRYSLSIIFPIAIIGFLLAGLIIIRLIKSYKSNAIDNNNDAEIEVKYKSKAASNVYKVLFHNRQFVGLTATTFIVYGATTAHGIYFGFLYTGGGGTIAGLGAAFLLMCLSETPFMEWGNKLSKQFTLERVVLLAILVSAGRFFWYATCPSYEFLLGTFFLHGFVNGILLIKYVKYLSQIVEPDHIGIAMSINQGFAPCIGATMCQLLGGYILDHFGIGMVYVFLGTFTLIGAGLYVGFGLHKHTIQAKRAA